MLSAARNGASEKLITPWDAKRSIRRTGYFVFPAKRLSRRYATPVYEAIQPNMPRTNRLLSRICENTSNARRSMSLKSPTSRGPARPNAIETTVEADAVARLNRVSPSRSSRTA